jgi:hypothetical protein
VPNRPSLEKLDQLGADQFVVFLEPPSLDGRILNQFALFCVMSDAVTKLNDWLRTREDLYRHILIPASLKGEIRDRLDQANITESVLFPG